MDRFLLTLYLFCVFICQIYCQTPLQKVNQHIEQAKDIKKKIDFRKHELNKACLYLNTIKKDSIKADRLIEIAYRYYQLKDSIQFLEVNKKAEVLTNKLQSDYLYGYLHWNYSSYYKKQSNFLEAYIHFNKAYIHFEKINKTRNAGIMLYGMAQIKGYYKDFAGSELLNIRATKIFKKLNDNLNLYKLHNHLGILQRDIKEYDKAIVCYNKAIEYYQNIPKNIKKESYIEIYNNIANAYFEKKEFQKALIFYNQELKNKNLRKDQFARIIHNRAYCKLKMLDTIGIFKDFEKALRIRETLNNKAGIVYSKKHLSDFYLFKKDSLKAFRLAEEANSLAKEIKNGVDYLTTLKQLANLDPQNSKKYLDRYIEFNDSLVSAERRMRNKFTRIEFETDEYIEETERLTQQRIWILVSSIGGLLILSLLYFLRVQKVNNEKLRIEAEHQKANEEVYVLTLQQQARVEEERIKERNRISEELHDGILGKLFGTRFGLGFLPLEGNDETLEKHQSLLDELQDIEKEIRDVSHKLSDNFNNTDINFTSIIKQLLEDKSIIGTFTHSIHFSQAISWKQIDEVTKANIYRIIQEALQNIIKHAKATHVSLHFEIKNDQLVLKIKDDGVGFDTKKGKRGIGIKNIKSRIEKLKGSIKIKSEINVGTTLQINTPCIKKDGQ
ncbi:Signal transduction histidine kinase [Tenacibaculum sp. MAR_2009_124]|uniref:tetratricopeptide repeat-containing sensor histidine kinase n=1 Tax=Tenacibaculum sp. MAR_2009_124 TaxID=1250059 RepID=UPI000895E1B7|nr:sensor histidine kinase [Tenacibaculum sp. MAR_2009_124]SEB42941.1 Signal transduction histidine kinase [Tenacibaculum sp. MAR_2009_124]